jgi:hypothetical protein
MLLHVSGAENSLLAESADDVDVVVVVVDAFTVGSE